MMEPDKGLELVTEAYLTQRLHSPRVNISDEYTKSLFNEIMKLKQDGISDKRILSKIQFETQNQLNNMKTYLSKIKASEKE